MEQKGPINQGIMSRNERKRGIKQGETGRNKEKKRLKTSIKPYKQA